MRNRTMTFALILCVGTSGAHAAAGDAAGEALAEEQRVAMLAVEYDRLDGLRRPEPDAEESADAGPVLGVDNESLLVEATLSAVSDFRRGGISSTRGKAALQGSIAVEHKTGLFGSLWASNVADNGGADIEVDMALGYGFKLAGLDAEAGIIGYAFPGVANSSYVELQAGLSTEFGPATVGVSIAYSPAQRNIGGIDNIYIGTGVEWPLSAIPLTLRASMGIEDGAFGDRKVDWTLGANYSLLGLDLGADYIDSARTVGTPDAGPTVVLSVSKTM
jgi:uncharacterized protein (TIGR02001 family)